MQTNKEYLTNIIHEAIENSWEVCAYGMGKIGRFSEEILSYFDLKADYYCDANVSKIQSYIEKGNGLTVDDLLGLEKDTLVFVFVGFGTLKEVEEKFRQNSCLHIVSWTGDLINNEYVLQRFLRIRSFCHVEKKNNARRIQFDNNAAGMARIAIYTCITGGYDKTYLPPKVVEKNCDYFCITDSELNKEKNVTYIKVGDVVPDDITDPKAQNRYCKMNGYRIFPEYDYSIYIDGNIQVVGRISELIYRVGKSGIGMYYRKGALGIYDELMHLIAINRVDKNEALLFAQNAAEVGVPVDTGLALGGIVVCKRDSEIGTDFLKSWQSKFFSGSLKRDMLYVPMVVEDTDLLIEDICTLGAFDFSNPEYIRFDHVHNGIR